MIIQKIVSTLFEISKTAFRSAIAERDRLALFVCHIDLYQLYIDHRGLDNTANLH